MRSIDEPSPVVDGAESEVHVELHLALAHKTAILDSTLKLGANQHQVFLEERRIEREANRFISSAVAQMQAKRPTQQLNIDERSARTQPAFCSVQDVTDALAR